MIELKPCPFCGQLPQVQEDFRYPWPERERTRAYEVVCQNSDCIIGKVDARYHGKKYCSVCTEFALHDRFGRERLSWFCPFCGAMMDGGEEK